MVDHRTVKAWLRVALGASVVGPLAAAACTPSNGNASTATASNAAPSASYQTSPPPGYPPPQGQLTPAYAPQPPPAYPATAGPPPQQPPPPAYPQAQPATAPQPAPTSAPAPSAPATASTAIQTPFGPVDPSQLQAILAGVQTAISGQMVTPGVVAPDLAEAGLKAYAFKAAAGMQPEGDELKQTLAEGQHAVMMVTMQAGKCYAILGFSAPGAVRDLDLNLLPPPYITLAGQDSTHNGAPSIGASPSPMCPVIPFPIQYKLDVFAKAGSGPVAVQLYSKTK